jgi:hypothetical protein
MEIRFSWIQAKSMLSRWGWTEDARQAHHWVRKDQTTILVPAAEDLDCRDKYDAFVSDLSVIYALNPDAMRGYLGAELCQ